jgi:hypothetical protein
MLKNPRCHIAAGPQHGHHGPNRQWQRLLRWHDI